MVQNSIKFRRELGMGDRAAGHGAWGDWELVIKSFVSEDGALRHYQNNNLLIKFFRAVTHPTI